MCDSVESRVPRRPAWCQSESEQSVLTINMGTGGSSHRRAQTLYIVPDKPVLVLTAFNNSFSTIHFCSMTIILIFVLRGFFSGEPYIISDPLCPVQRIAYGSQENKTLCSVH